MDIEVRERVDIVRPAVILDPSDQVWMASFGFTPDLTDPEVLASLNDMIILGSCRLEKEFDEQHFARVSEVRHQFFTLLGLDEIVEKFHKPTAIPLDTFVGSQRACVELGLDPLKIINKHQPALGYSQETYRDRAEDIASIGLDPVKVIHSNPSVLSSARKSFTDKIENFEALNLNPAVLINNHAAVLNLANETVQEKVRFIERSAKLLGWEHSAAELIELYPPILGFSMDKLRILRRIAATSIDVSGRKIEPKRVKRDLITPLENYVISSNSTHSYDFVTKEAKKLRLDSAERKQRALGRSASGRLGRVGAMYLNYRGIR